MPYSSEKIPIAGTQYDRRRKLTDDQKDCIRWLREEEQLSHGKLAKMFNVSKRLIQFICDPEAAERDRRALKERRSDGRYKYTKEKWNEVQREHRRHKHQLQVEGKI